MCREPEDVGLGRAAEMCSELLHANNARPAKAKTQAQSRPAVTLEVCPADRTCVRRSLTHSGNLRVPSQQLQRLAFALEVEPSQLRRTGRHSLGHHAGG